VLLSLCHGVAVRLERERDVGMPESVGDGPRVHTVPHERVSVKMTPIVEPSVWQPEPRKARGVVPIPKVGGVQRSAAWTAEEQTGVTELRAEAEFPLLLPDERLADGIPCVAFEVYWTWEGFVLEANSIVHCSVGPPAARR
jgi:hypothetical protein